MTTVVTLANMPSGSPTDVAVDFLDQALLSLRSSSVSADGATQRAEYVFASGDPTTETTVSVQSILDVKSNILRSSIRLRTVQFVVTDSVTTEAEPVDVIISWNIPGRSEDTGKILKMIGTAFGLAFNGVTTKVPNTGIIGKINRSLLHNLYG